LEGEYKEGERWSGEFSLLVEWNASNDCVLCGGYRISDKSADEFGQYLGKFTYRNGVWNGPVVIYDESGKVNCKENHTNGLLNGPSVCYYDDGATAWTGNFNNGKADGKSTDYDKEGNITDEDIYEDGVCVESCEEDD